MWPPARDAAATVVTGHQLTQYSEDLLVQFAAAMELELFEHNEFIFRKDDLASKV